MSSVLHRGSGGRIILDEGEALAVEYCMASGDEIEGGEHYVTFQTKPSGRSVACSVSRIISLLDEIDAFSADGYMMATIGRNVKYGTTDNIPTGTHETCLECGRRVAQDGPLLLLEAERNANRVTCHYNCWSVVNESLRTALLDEGRAGELLGEFL